MAMYVWVSNSNAKLRYYTSLQYDPNTPANYTLTSGSDGARDEAVQVFVAGVNSGGFPAYIGDPSQSQASPDWPNGILGAASGQPGTKS